ncbi:MAG: GvpL/GvpF family gas vesicle protein [bacterium]
MRYLVYCILKAPGVNGESTAGVMGKTVYFVTAQGLAAAVSEAASLENTPPVDELLVYSRVVEELFFKQAVVPLRYGCFLEGQSEVRRILEEGADRYGTLLNTVEGCVEMGIKLLFPKSAAIPSPSPQEAKSVNGGGYLEQRRAHYQMQEADTRQYQSLIDGYVQAFAGLYSRHRTETATRDGAIVLSLYFLVSRNNIDRFRETFRPVVEQEGVKTLISGPWPPYNFVCPEFGERSP